MRLLLAIWTLAVLSPAAAPAQPACAVLVHVTGARNTTGVIGGLLFRTDDGWPEERDKAIARGSVPIQGGGATLKLEGVPPGDYGLVVLHDENANRKLDRNFFGKPKEGFGFANNPKVFLSAPKMKDATLSVTCPVTEVNVRLQYK